MEPVVITWNVTNWITVVVMAFLGFLILGLAAQLVRRTLPKAA